MLISLLDDIEGRRNSAVASGYRRNLKITAETAGSFSELSVSLAGGELSRNMVETCGLIHHSDNDLHE